METKQAVQEMTLTGKWVDVVEEPCWVTLKAQSVQEPAVLATRAEEPYSSAFELTLSRSQQVTFDLGALQTIITIQGTKAEKD